MHSGQPKQNKIINKIIIIFNLFYLHALYVIEVEELKIGQKCWYGEIYNQIDSPLLLL